MCNILLKHHIHPAPKFLSLTYSPPHLPPHPFQATFRLDQLAPLNKTVSFKYSARWLSPDFHHLKSRNRHFDRRSDSRYPQAYIDILPLGRSAFIHTLFTYDSKLIHISSNNQKRRQRASSFKLVTYSGPLGKTSITCVFKGQKHSIDFENMARDAPVILGRQTSTHLKMVKWLYSMGKEAKMLKDYENLFSGLGCLHSIKIDPEVRPLLPAPRRIPVAL